MKADENLSMTFSGVLKHDGKNAICVRFERNGAYAEGYLPAAVIERSDGFAEEELGMLRAYMREHSEEILTEAKKLNNIKRWFA